MDIDIWLNKFKQNWINHDFQKVLSLFHKNVIYYETPFHKLHNRSQLEEAWKGISTQDNIKLSLKIYSKEHSKYTILWHLKYLQKNEVKEFAGTYLIELNNENLCTYFFHCCEGE